MPSIDPRASPSGKTWQATATVLAPARASTARSHSFPSIIRGLLQLLHFWWLRHPGLPEELLDALAVGGGRVLDDLQGGEELEPDLAAQGGPQVGHRMTDRLHRGLPGLVRPEDAHEDLRLPEVRRHLHRRDGHESDARVSQVLESLAEHLPGKPLDPLGPGIRPRHRPDSPRRPWRRGPRWRTGSAYTVPSPSASSWRRRTTRTRTTRRWRRAGEAPGGRPRPPRR